jgi:Tfp pilus assembly protein PilO
LGLVAIVYFNYMFGKPAIETFAANVEKDKVKIESLKTELATVEEFKKLQATGEWEKVKTRIEQVSRRLPKSTRPQDFYQALQSILEQTGVTVNLLKPDEVQRYERFAEIPYSIKVQARFHEFGHFLNLVEENPQRFMRVKQFRVTNDLNRPSIHPVDVNLASFMLIGEPPKTEN